MGGFFKTGCDNDCTWLIILMLLFCCGDCKGICSCDSCWTILILLLLCSCKDNNPCQPCGC